MLRRRTVIVCGWIPVALAGCATTGAKPPAGEAPAGAGEPRAEAGAIAAAFYVAPNGNDDWSGKFPVPNVDGTDGPFATITRARDAVSGSRLLRTSIGDIATPKPYTVLIRGGTYRISEPIVFRPEDSGTPDSPITYAAYPGETPVFSGGKVITGWKRDAGTVWTAHIPEVEAGELYFHQLFVNGERRTRARHPNDGYLRTDGPLPWLKNYRDRKNVKTKMGFRYKDDDLKRWDRLDDVNLFVYHSWTASLQWIKELDEEQRVVKFTAPSNWPIGYWERKQRYYVENALELLDAPGEWYLIRDTGVLCYWPMPGEDMRTAEVIAPTVRKLVRFDGSNKDGKPVKHIHLKGLTFEHADWYVKDRGRADGQAAAWLEAAVFARDTHHCVIQDCTVRHVGEYGVYFERGCTHNKLFRCRVHDLGAGGVRLGYMSGEKDPDTASHHNVVDNCFLHDGGHVFRAGVGAWIGRSSHNRLTHNEICDFDYTGISVGWSWGYQPSSAHHNTVEYNHVHHIGNGVLSDMGGIYSLGISPGSVTRHNIFHDIYSYAYGGWGLYTDEGSSNILMENNLVYNTKTGGFHQHYGRENIVRNNILAFSEQHQIQRSREEKHISFTFERNIVYFDNGILLGGRWKNGNWKMDDNCYWDTSDPQIEFAGQSLAEWRKRGFDQHSIIADPLFVDAENRDFRLKPESPVFEKIGFKRFAFDEVGLYGDKAWVRLPLTVEHRKREGEPKAETTFIDDGFEGTSVGSVADMATTSGETDKARIRVTEEQAATGKRSLKFVDTPGLERGYNPHLYYKPFLRKGVAKGSFDVLLEPKATFMCEWRDYAGSGYQTGPQLTINPDGGLVAGGKQLMKLPTGTWIRIEIACGVGKDKTGKYDLTVTVRSESPKRFAKLPLVAKGFRRLEWVGFITHHQTNCTFYVDNVSVK